MSSQKPVYVTCVCLLAFIFSLPCMIGQVENGINAYLNRSWTPFVPQLPGLAESVHEINKLAWASFWNDKFVYCDNEIEIDVRSLSIVEVDPETGESITKVLNVARPFAEAYTQTFGDRIWWTTADGYWSVEAINDVAKPSPIAIPAGHQGYGMNFLLDGEPAMVEHSRISLSVLTFNSGAWQSIGRLILPASDESPGGFEIRTFGDRVHLFLMLDGRVYHREGIELEQEPIAFEVDGNGHAVPSASALRPINTDAALAGWSLVRPSPAVSVVKTKKITFHLPSLTGMFVGGQPALMVFDFDQLDSNNPIGHFYRFDGSNWTEFASYQFPLGSHFFRTYSTRDGERSYIVAPTSTGTENVFAVETSGIRKTNGGKHAGNPMLEELFNTGISPTISLVSGVLFAAVIWRLMWWYTKPDYDFGVQTIKLASVGQRGIARLIDLVLIVTTTASLGWVMTIGFDWSSLAEALNLRIDHPSVRSAVKVAAVLAAWLFVVSLAIVTSQAVWGITPGKWLCGLRTVRTTLRPCGFASSLAREIVFFIDCGNFLCWTPGILSIALTNHRQRLGDLVADTIVVESQSLTAGVQALACPNSPSAA